MIFYRRLEKTRMKFKNLFEFNCSSIILNCIFDMKCPKYFFKTKCPLQEIHLENISDS